MKVIANICRILIGLVFIFSGFVKGVDPLGSAYKFTDYFNAFGMSWMNFSSLFLSFAQSLLECIIGICLFLNIRTRLAAWGALLFMSVFTPLTLILAIKNPVTDCGCFGDAWILTNWETFWKNVVLLALALAVFFYRNRFKSLFNFLEQITLTAGSLLFIAVIAIHCYRHLPILDFRPYAIGANISEGMAIPEGAPHDEYRMTLTYKNRQTGELKDFDESNYPWQDTLTWEFHSSDQKLIREGYKAPIHDFVIEHPQYGNITEELLGSEEYVLLAISYNVNKASATGQEELNRLAAYAQQKGYRFYGLTASLQEDVQKHTEKYNIPYEFCATDEIQLKTIVRSNPGLVVLKKGTVTGKWGNRDIPAVDGIGEKDLLAYCLTEQQQHAGRNLVYLLVFLYLTLLFAYLVKKYKRMIK